LQDIVTAHAAALYRGYEILSAAPFRVTRNSNLYLQEEESRNLLDAVDSQLHSRRRGDAVRLEIEEDANPEIIARLRDNFGVEPSLVFSIRGPISLSRLFHLYEETPRPDLKFRPFTSRKLALGEGPAPLFEILRRQNILLHHPYESYSTVVNFIESAAKDPDVLSIKQTLYRTNEDSPIVRALMDAAAANKEVTVVVELKARFDEASNIRFARHMEEAGVQVVHGVVGLKTHCKLALLARQEPDGKIRRFAHVGTGNYNPVTARFYTDLSFFTSDEKVTSSVHDVFNFLTAYAEHGSYDPLFVAPKDMSRNCLQLIEREISHARRGRPARIIAKVNALLDRPIIHALYRASRAGVEIDLIVRGACALRPGVRGLSDRIRVRSIVGRFLEHSRIFFFENGSQPEIYLGSADWMPRNLHERVEVMLHVNDNDLCRRIYSEILMLYLADNEKARVLRADASWVSARHSNQGNASKNGHSFNAQEYMIRAAEGTGAESLQHQSLPASVKGALGRRFSPAST
jgi:polyphosphate kinase